jgi:hypothetical protein
MSSTKHKVLAFGADNREAARTILADVTRYGGENSAMVIWARAIVAKEAANGSTNPGRSASEKPEP